MAEHGGQGGAGGKRRGADRRRDRRGRHQQPASQPDRLPFERANWLLFGVALAVIAIGYGFLAGGSITLAPLLLVLGYCVLVPLAIIYRPRSRSAAPPVEPRDRSA
jgi:hypothetical protein